MGKMKTTKELSTFIGIDAIKDFYEEQCEEIGRKFSEKEFNDFLIFCETDFYDWLNTNWKHFEY